VSFDEGERLLILLMEKALGGMACHSPEQIERVAHPRSMCDSAIRRKVRVSIVYPRFLFLGVIALVAGLFGFLRPELLIRLNLPSTWFIRRFPERKDWLIRMTRNNSAVVFVAGIILVLTGLLMSP
jgi:hypothetical protein